MRESRTYGFVRGAHSDMRPYRDPYLPSPYPLANRPSKRTPLGPGQPYPQGIGRGVRLQQPRAGGSGDLKGESLVRFKTLASEFIKFFLRNQIACERQFCPR